MKERLRDVAGHHGLCSGWVTCSGFGGDQGLGASDVWDKGKGIFT